MIRFIFLLSLLVPRLVFADWQSTLEENFDIVDTFDGLSDWSGTSTTYDTTPANQPKKQDTSASIWGMYQSDFTKNGAAEHWISDHGEYSFNRGGSITPKSLCLQHNILYETDDDADQGHGAQRLATFFGDGVSGKTGYKKIHIFFMLKFRPGYFAKRIGSTTDYAYMGYLKFFETMSGYTGIQKWGTDAERATANPIDAVLTSYGTNATVFNFQSGGDTYGKTNMFPLETTLTAVDLGSGWQYQADPVRIYSTGSVGIDNLYEAESWMGIEAVIDAGTVDTANGTIDFYLYDSSGTEVGHYSATGESRMVHFDHYFNRVVLGGNRALHTGDDAVIPDDTRAYIDDFIVHDSRIGPTYFQLLGAKTKASISPTGTIFSSRSAGTPISILE